MLEKATKINLQTRCFVWPFVSIGTIACLISTEVLAAPASTQAQNSAGVTSLFVAWGIAYLTRRRAIGGWLLYFYIQLYLSLLLSLLFFPQIISNLNPTEWDSAMRYVLFILSTVPLLLAEGLEAFAATRLLFDRTEKNLLFFRKALIALFVASTVSVGIDIAYFTDAPTIIFDVLTFVFAIIWTLYFWKAKRVNLVFIEKTWDYGVHSTKRVSTPQEKSYLRKRAAISGVTAFVIFLLWAGVSIGDTKPDSRIFFIPLFYALVAATVGWYAPIRKKKLDALLNIQATNE